MPEYHKCALTGQPMNDPVEMHRDLSDWWPQSLHDMRDESDRNVMVVERDARTNYYHKLKQLGCVLSFSGGLDSATVLHWARHLFGEVHCLIFDYGQRHKCEVQVAMNHLDGLKADGAVGRVTWDVVKMDVINELGHSALTRSGLEPEVNEIEDMGKVIPNTFVPGRNIYFITAVAQAAFSRGWRHTAVGVNQLDYSGYPDCRPEFLAPMQEAIKQGVYNGTDFAIHAPLMDLDKTQIIRLGLELGVNYADTHSCYNGVKGGCGECDSCKLRRAAFEKLGMKDPSIDDQPV